MSTEGERASDRRKVHNNRVETTTVFGVSKVGLLGAVAVGIVIWEVADGLLAPGLFRTVSKGGAILAALSVVIATFHTPGHLPVHEHARRILAARSRQQVMLSARKDSKKKQPKNNSKLGILARGISKIPWLGDQLVEGEVRAEDAVQIRRPFHNSPAIETIDGGVVGAIKVRPAAMAVADKSHWETRVNRLANAIDSSVISRVQFVSKMRAVDYGDRYSTYAAREQYHLNRLAEPDGGTESAYEKARRGEIGEEELGAFVAADLCDERQDVIDMYDVTTLTRDYYVSMKVTPSDIIGDEYVESGGGWDNVPLLGRYLKRRKLQRLREEGDHTSMLIENLETKMSTLEADLRTIDDISTHTLSSTQLAQVFADHYKAANAYAIADFGDIIRQSPKPISSSGMSMYGVTHDHLRDVPEAPLHGSGRTGDRDDEDEDGDGEEDDKAGSVGAASTDGRSPKEMAEEIAEINDNPIADVVVTEDQLVDKFRSDVGPADPIDREHSDWIAIDNAVYSKTLSIRTWPGVPKMGILEPILREHEPGVAVNVATHIDPLNQDDAENAVGQSEEMRSKKTDKAEESWFESALSSVRSEHDESTEMLDAMRDSDYDLFKTNTHIEVRSADPKALSRTIDRINSAMNDEGAEVRQETEHHYEGWQSVSPACEDKIGGAPMMLADGVAREFPWTSRNLHEPDGVEFGINMHTDEPLYLDLWNRKVGYDFGIFTKKGGGKTTTATEILNRYKMVKGDDLMTIIIDPLQEFANLATVHDGERIVVGGDNGINPFHLEATPSGKLDVIGRDAPYKHWLEGCLDFVEMYYADEGMDFSGKKGVWRMAIKAAGERYGITKDPKTHSAEYRIEQGYSGDCPTPLDAIDVIDEMTYSPEEWVRAKDDQEPPGEKVDQRRKTAVEISNDDVQPFLDGGEYEHFTKQTDIDLDGATMFYVDMQQQEASTSIGLTMQVVYDLFYELVKTIDIPSVIFMDEFHYMLRDTVAQKSLNQKFRHGRHWDLSLGVATQSFKDFFGEDDQGNAHLTDNAGVLFENMPTRIFHRAEMTEEWAEQIDLTGDEAEFIRNAEPGDPELGYSTALLWVDDKGTYPLKVKMDIDENPRETVVTEYDPSEHGEDFYSYLLDHDDECEWRFTPPKGADVVENPTLNDEEAAPTPTPPSEQSGRATELDDAEHAEVEAADQAAAEADDSDGDEDSDDDTTEDEAEDEAEAEAEVDGGRGMPARDENGRFISKGGED